MELDESIVQLAAKLDAWFGGNLATFASQDPVAQGKALLDGVQLAKEFDRLKAKGLAGIAALLIQKNSITSVERVASLVCGFEFSAKLMHCLHDELSDTDGCNEIVRLMNQIAATLDTLGSGRVALAALLKHADPRVRASAGAYLIDVMPDQVVPILHEIDEKSNGSSADFTAHWALLDWELKEKENGKT
jgi:hypothetical protein